MSKLKTGLVVALGASLMSLPAFGGQSSPVVVTVDLDTMFAQGDMITARDDKNDDVFIGCGTRNVDTGAGLFSWAFCQAEDDEGDRVNCFTFDPEMVKTINAINDTSYIQFAWTDDGSGTLTCSRMGFSTQSFYLDKHTMGNTQGKKE